MSKLEDTLAEQIRWAGLPEPTREYAFAKESGRRWRFDFVWFLDVEKPSLGPARIVHEAVVVEVDGGTRSGGRHVRGDGYERDCEKLNEAALRGFRVLRVTSDMVTDGRALRLIQRALGKEAA